MGEITVACHYRLRRIEAELPTQLERHTSPAEGNLLGIAYEAVRPNEYPFLPYSNWALIRGQKERMLVKNQFAMRAESPSE